MFEEHEKALLEKLILEYLQLHLENRTHGGNLILLPNRSFLLSDAHVQACKDILVKLAGMDSRHEKVKGAAIDYPWCPEILELELYQIMMLVPDMQRGHKIKCIKTLREMTGLGLKHAKEFLDTFIPMSADRAVFDFNQSAENMISAWKIRKQNFTGVTLS